MLKIYIPDSQFEEGGIYYRYNRNQVQVFLALNHSGHRSLRITVNPVTLEDWEFHPPSNIAYSDLLQYVHKNMVVIERDGVVQTPTELTALFRENFQEL